MGRDFEEAVYEIGASLLAMLTLTYRLADESSRTMSVGASVRHLRVHLYVPQSCCCAR